MTCLGYEPRDMALLYLLLSSLLDRSKKTWKRDGEPCVRDDGSPNKTRRRREPVVSGPTESLRCLIVPAITTVFTPATMLNSS